MNRKEFLKKLGLGALVVAVAPKVLADDGYTEGLIPFIRRTSTLSFKDAQLIADEDLKIRMQYPLTPMDAYESYGNGIEFWYDFRDMKNAIIDNNGQLIGWQDKFNNNHFYFSK